jgi:hypothetical protein
MKKLLNLIFLCFLLQTSFGQSTDLKPIAFSILPVFGKKTVREGEWYLSPSGDSIQLTHLQFYLSDLQLELSNGQIISDPQKAHLIDIFEPSTLQLAIPIDPKNASIKSLHFNLGIDSTTNVSGAQAGDLDPVNGMYWSWQSGYINLKMEGVSPKCNTRKHAFQYHIGGYLQPNRALRKIELHVDTTPQEEIFVKMDLATFFSNINFTTLSLVMTPGSNAMKLANYCTQMFSIHVPKK